MRLREFMAKHEAVCVNNTPQDGSGGGAAGTGAAASAAAGARLLGNADGQGDGFETFEVFRNDEPSYSSPVWLSGGHLLVCYCARDGEVLALPVEHLVGVQQGLSTAELKARRSSTVLCCIESENTEITQSADRFLSLISADGTSLDLRASSRRSREKWVTRFESMLSIVPFARHQRTAVGFNRRQALHREQARVAELKLARTGQLAKVKHRAATARRHRENRDKIRAKYQRLRNS